MRSKGSTSQGTFKMVIKCTLSVSLKNIAAYSGKLSEFPPLPWYITRRGPFIHDGAEGDDEIITIYEFDKSRLEEAWEIISNQLNALQHIPGLTFSVHRSTVFAQKTEKKTVKWENRKLARLTKKEA